MWDINLVRTCWSGTVLLRVSIATMNHHDKKSSWGGQTLFRLYIHITHCSSLKKIRIGIQSEKEHRCGSWHRGHEGVLIVGLLLMSCSAFFFVEPMTTSTEMAPSFVIKKKSFADLPKTSSYGGILLFEIPFSQKTFTSVKLT